jgi:5'-phosphate synthase pdxT subunit
MVKTGSAPVVGLLALQGDFAKHTQVLESLGARVVEVRRADELQGIDALIIPGGESTTMTRLMSDELRSGLIDFAASRPLWGTCAGMIMLTTDASDPRVVPLGLVDMNVARMGFGRQIFSFEAPVRLSAELPEPARAFNGFFIRAWLDQEPVALRKGNILLTSFHPELAADSRFHAYFLSMLS